MTPKKIFPFLCCFFFIVSCTDNLDFSQIEDYNATPEYTTSLTYFTVLPFQFFNQLGVQENEKTDITDFKIFENSYFRDNLVKIDFNVEIKNEFDRDFTIQIVFLNQNNSATHTFQEINVNANNLDYKFQETVEVSTNSNVKNTVKVRITVKIVNSTVQLDPADTSEFEFKSSAKIYIDTDA
ncbi:hypothetical protein [Polaribacter sp. Hel1_85]|uniref:hypothetical protein n=1 Tax=Polaribacter sp. Hel1_85 TaxID=1250005 RepID=UPI00052DD9F2|nr:hypothetical protein [Polaribacter sp. Hel1_85]KGL62824.1 hypothetical protein PHEL85_2619 [Polaribacter sp. Hel1_85]